MQSRVSMLASERRRNSEQSRVLSSNELFWGKLSAAEAATQRLSKQAVGSRGPKPLIAAPLRRRSLTSDRGMEVRRRQVPWARILLCVSFTEVCFETSKCD